MQPQPTRRHPRRRPAAVLTTALSLLLLLTACSGGDASSEDGATSDTAVVLEGDARSVAVGVLRQPHLSHPLFYDDFLPGNVDLEVIPFATSTEIKNAVVSGDLQFGVTGITSALQGAAAGESVVVVASAADGGSAIVAGTETGIAAVEDLRGARIGFVPGSAQDILLRLTLQDAGLDPLEDVELVNVGFADMANALAGGDIDAFSGAEVGPSDALTRGDGVLVTHPYDTAMGRINIAFVTSQQVIDGDPDLVQAMVAVHALATDHMAANTEEWADAVVSQYGFPEESLALAIDNIFLGWLIDDTYIESVEVLGAEQLALDQIQAEPDYATFIDPTFVQALAADAVAEGE